jgi:hypothetical protein
MAKSLSFQNGVYVKSENIDPQNIQFQFDEKEKKVNITANIFFNQGTPGININKEFLSDGEFEMGEIEVDLNKLIGKEPIAVYLNSIDADLYLNLKIKLNKNARKKWMVDPASPKKWMVK